MMTNKLIKWYFLWCFLLSCYSQLTMAEIEISKTSNLNQTNQNDGALNRQLTDFVDFVLSPNSGGSQGRTFGLKRIQFMMMPMVFKLGVIMTLLVFLTVISLKGLTIGVVLLILKLSTIMGKFFTMVRPPQQPQISWAPPSHGQPLNVHFHNDGYHNHPYAGWVNEGPSTLGHSEQHYYPHRRQQMQPDQPYYL